MFLVPNLKHFAVKHCALLLGCLLAQHSAFARLDHEPIFFQAANVPGPDAFATSLLAAREEKNEAAFAAFAPMANAASIRALIASLEEAGDSYSPKLAELSEKLGRALQAEGEYRAALDAYDRSYHIIRRQEGLVSAAQA